jgi:hypothetical protein
MNSMSVIIFAAGAAHEWGKGGVGAVTPPGILKNSTRENSRIPGIGNSKFMGILRIPFRIPWNSREFRNSTGIPNFRIPIPEEF